MDPILMQELTDALTLNGNGINASGDVASRLLASNFDVEGLRTNAVLRKDEWIQYDTAVVEVARQTLVGVADLLNAGLRFDVGNALGKTRVEWEKVTDMEPAEVNMAGVTEGERDRVEFSLVGVPLPITHKDFRINIRALEASRTTGESLDTTQARLSTRLVNETLEDMLFNGRTLTAVGATIYGYTTAPNRNTGSLTGNWADSTAVSGEQILGDVLKMIDILDTDNMRGPFALYVPRDYWIRMLDDFKANSDKSIFTRINEIPELTVIRGTSNLSRGASGETTMVQMTEDVVDMVVGLQPVPLQWESQGGMQVNFKVMAIMVPRVKDTAANQSGVAHFSV